MQVNSSSKKNIHQINFDEDSSDEQNNNKKQDKYKFQKIYDLDVQYNIKNRDKFSINKVSKGLFVNENHDVYEYENFQVQHKPKQPKKIIKQEKKEEPKKLLLLAQNKQLKQQNNKISNQANSLTIRKKPISLDFIQSSSDSENQQTQHKQNSPTQNENQQQNPSQNSDIQRKIVQQNEQNMLNSKKKMLALNFSQSSSSQDQSKKQENKQKINKKMKSKQNQNQKSPALIKKSQNQNNQNQQEQQQNNQQDQEQSQASQDPEQQNQKPKKVQKIYNDFLFDKQPQYQVLDQIRPGQRVRAYISRSRSGFNILWPQYIVRIQSTKLQILYIKKQTNLFKNVYKIYNRTKTGHQRYFGKLQSNLSSTQYQIHISQNGVHQILKAQVYFPNETKNNQPRYFIMLNLIDGFTISDLRIVNPDQISLRDLYKIQQNKNKIQVLHTRKPVFNQQIRGFVLNFGGRVNQPSIKNFILEDVQKEQEVLMFGRIDKQNFRLQLSTPFNCVLGAAVALIQFQSRFMQ